jgi:hypothetical protein
MMDQDDRKLRDKPDQRKAEEHRLVSAVSPWHHTILRLSFCLSSCPLLARRPLLSLIRSCCDREQLRGRSR